MLPDDKTRELKERLTGLTDEELLEIVEVEADDYTPEALDIARTELTARGIEFSEDSEPSEEPAASTLPCSVCGAETRTGVMFADRELTIVFTDNEQENFVNVHACTNCGRVQLVVDYETDVQQ
jgi:hypothetical protein